MDPGDGRTHTRGLKPYKARRNTMKPVLALILALLGVGIGAGVLIAAPNAPKFSPHQEPSGIGNLVVPGEHVALIYDAGVKPATGAVFVRNDRRRRFVRLPLAAERGRSSNYLARVPRRLIRGHRLLYYAILRDPRTRRSARVPAKGTSSALILEHPKVIDLGKHRYGDTRAPDEIVARAKADQVGWQIPPPGPKAGPQSFLVAPNYSILLHDSFNDRMLVWKAGDPDTIVRSIPLPDRTADNDVALGPKGSLYVTHGEGHGLGFHMVLKRLGPNGEQLWSARLAADFLGRGQDFLVGANSELRRGPRGKLHVLAGMFGRPGGEFGWMPVATARGDAIPMHQQRRGTDWPYQPIAAGERLVTEVYTAVPDSAPHEVRVAIVNRRGELVRAWRVISRTDINLHATPDALRGAPTLVLDVTKSTPTGFKWEYEVVRLGASPASFALPRLTYGDNILPDVRMGPGSGGGVYQLSSDPSFGVQILRYAF
jgi:hypothetical protein